MFIQVWRNLSANHGLYELTELDMEIKKKKFHTTVTLEH